MIIKSHLPDNDLHGDGRVEIEAVADGVGLTRYLLFKKMYYLCSYISVLLIPET